jgi:hypothetical protein
MGILDNKTRILDSIITLEGRKQLANGGINIRYVSFTDSATFYAADLESGSADATARIFLESCHLPQDEITFQSDESGKIFALKSAANVIVKSGQLLNSELITGSLKLLETTTVQGDQLQNFVNGFLTSSIDNFKKQQIIATKDSFFDDDGFALSNDNIEFTIHNNRPLEKSSDFIANISQLEDLYSDPRLSNVKNFKYLPPINRVDENIDKSDIDLLKNNLLGNYLPFGSTKTLTYDDVLREHTDYAKTGYCKVINFEPSSRSNNLFLQAFEVTNDTMFKLDIIDFGVWNSNPHPNFIDTNMSNMPGQTMHILFVGKLLTKPEIDVHSFIHLFTLIFG